jgi:vanillate O-demethylase ferredoxin subunit
MDRLHVSLPRNLFPIAKTARRHILFAGGIGVTPILSMARQLSKSEADFAVYYSVRSQREAAFYKELVSLGKHVSLLADGRAAAQAVLIEALSQVSHDTHLYACGPSDYIHTVREIARRQGWSDSQFHSEAFSATPLPPEGIERAFTVRLARTGVTIPVAEDETVIHALKAHGFSIPSSCEQGICGTCLTKVISGVPDHRDQYLTDDERDTNTEFLPCCSRSKSHELVLDL